MYVQRALAPAGFSRRVEITCFGSQSGCHVARFIVTQGSNKASLLGLLIHCVAAAGKASCVVQWQHTNLVDPASSHMLVSKIKPCMSQYKLLYGETANGSLKQL